MTEFTSGNAPGFRVKVESEEAHHESAERATELLRMAWELISKSLTRERVREFTSALAREDLSGPPGESSRLIDRREHVEHVDVAEPEEPRR